MSSFLYSFWLKFSGVVLITFYPCGMSFRRTNIFDTFIIERCLHLLIFTLPLFRRVNWEESVAKMNSTEKSHEPLGKIATGLPSVDSSSTNDSESVKRERETYLIVYTCIMVLGTICYVCRSFSFFRMCLRISINLHDMIFRGISRAKMIFFNNNPSGRILNRFARDINNVDSLLPITMVEVLHVSIPSIERIHSLI